MPEKKNSQTGNFLSWLFKKHFLKLEIIFTPTIDKEPEKSRPGKIRIGIIDNGWGTRIRT